MPRHGACCLGSINLSEFVVNPYTDKAHFDSGSFVRAVHCGVRTLDRLIDENYARHPLKEQQEMSFNYRNIGLGVFGYATMLMKLNLKYGSDNAIDLTDSLFGLMFRAAVIESNKLAKKLGPFPKYCKESQIFDSDIMAAHFDIEERAAMAEYGLRNCSLLSVAPTGSIGTMMGESGGCEPEFAIKYQRRTVGMTEGEDTYYDIYCKAAREYMEVNQTNPFTPELPKWFVSAYDIPWERRILTQSIMQKHVDTGISSTVNLPHSATVEDVRELYLKAWQCGLKGVTIFREGCARMPILSTEKKKEEPKKWDEALDKEFFTEEEIAESDRRVAEIEREINARKVGKMRKLTTGCGSLHLTAFFNSATGDLMEIFLNKGSSGGCNNFMIGLSRMVSLCCKNGMDIEEIVDQLNSCGVCPSYAVRRAVKQDTSAGSCCPVAVGLALMEMWREMQNEISKSDYDGDECAAETEGASTDIVSEVHEGASGDRCPNCGSRIEHAGGCDLCRQCGWSRCE